MRIMQVKQLMNYVLKLNEVNVVNESVTNDNGITSNEYGNVDNNDNIIDVDSKRYNLQCKSFLSFTLYVCVVISYLGETM